MRRDVQVIAVLLLLLIPLVIWRRSRPAESKAKPRLEFIVTDSINELESRSKLLAEESKRQPDPLAARQALGRALGFLSPNHWNFYGYSLEEMHDGAYPEYRRFCREFLAAAGRDVVPIVESLLPDCRSPQAKFLLVSVLGDAHAPEAVPLLKKLLDAESDRSTVQAALFSIGMSNTSEGFEFLTEFIRSGKAGGPNEPAGFQRVVIAALGQQGERALDFLLEEARRNTAENQHPNPYIIGGIRGRGAVERLQSLVRADPDPMIRLGAAMALASTTDSAQLESLASLDPATAGRALLAARNRPDIWNESAATRRKVAERVLAGAGPPTGDFQKDSVLLEAARFLPADRSRSLMESLAAAKPPRSRDREEIIRFVAAFSDQPDAVERAHQMGKAWGLSESECKYVVNEGIKAGSLPGRQVHPATIERLFEIVGDPDSQEWQRQQAMSSLMLAGVPEAVQTGALSRFWNQPLSAQQRREILCAVTIGIHTSTPAIGPLLGTKPESFLRSILHESQDPMLRSWAAYAYYSGGSPSKDPVAQGTLDAFLRYARASTGEDGPEKHPITWYALSKAVVAHFAKYGTSADLPALSRWGADFAGASGTEAARKFQEEMNFAIDAIKLSGR